MLIPSRGHSFHRVRDMEGHSQRSQEDCVSFVGLIRLQKTVLILLSEGKVSVKDAAKEGFEAWKKGEAGLSK